MNRLYEALYEWIEAFDIAGADLVATTAVAHEGTGAIPLVDGEKAAHGDIEMEFDDDALMQWVDAGQF